ncbi:MAG: GGDEF domain-containing protein [Candidatus Geothermincolia bacterium]
MPEITDTGWTRLQYREAILRIGFVALMAVLALGESRSGEPGSLSALAIFLLALAYAGLRALMAALGKPLLYSGRLPYAAAAVDLTTLLLLIQFTGGVSSRVYLLLGLTPFITGIYLGERGFWLSLLAVLVGYSAILFAGAPDMPVTGEATTWAVRYAYIAGAWLTAGLVSGRLRRERRRRQLVQIPRDAAGTPALSGMISELCTKTARFLGCRVCFVLFPDSSGRRLTIPYAGVGLPLEALPEVFFDVDGDGVFASAFARSESRILYGRMLREGELGPLGSRIDPWDLMATPLAGRNRRLGVLVAAGKRRGFFQGEDLEELKAIAADAAVYVENASLYLSSEENVARLNTLMSSGNTIGAVVKVEELCDLGLDLAKNIFAADAMELAVKEPEQKDFRFVRGFGFAPPVDVVDCERPRVCREGEGDCRLLGRTGGGRAAACVPLTAGGRQLGVLRMASRDPRAFSEDDVGLAQALAEQLALALERAFLLERVNRLAVTDELTGLYNIRQLSRVLSDEMKRASRYRRHFSFIMADIDHFKAYNDRNGHLQGNRLLAEIASLLIENKRDVDTAFRYGGEEFCLVLPEVGKRDAFFAAERLRRAVEEHSFPGEADQPGGRLTVSLGVASFPEDARQVGGLMEAADQALYLAKARGRNRSVAASESGAEPLAQEPEDRSWPRSA